MPFLFARRPVRSGVECAFLSRAAVDVLFNAGFEGLCANRSGFGLKVDLMPRADVYAIAGFEICVAFCCIDEMRERVDDGRRYDGGISAQLMGTLGGIVVITAQRMRCNTTMLVMETDDFPRALGPLTT